MIYLDNAASTPLLEETAEFYSQQIRNLFGNPHADHAYSHKCRQAIQKATRQIQTAVKVPDAKILWTSGGTECINTVINGIGLVAGDEVITSEIEHPATLRPLEKLAKEGVIVHKISVNSKGFLNVDEIENLLSDNTKLVTLISLHNELGSFTDLEKVGAILKQADSKALFHTDNVQGFGKTRINWKKCRLDFMSTAGHKFHAPNSCGCLIMGKNTELEPFILGGGQQNGLRSGTQDPAAISAYGFAAELNDKNKDDKLALIQNLNTLCREGLQTLVDKKGNPLEIHFHSAEDNSPYMLLFSIKGFEGAIIMRFLSSMGTYIGVGSACSADSKEPNKTLTAMGVPKDIAFGAIRASFGWQSKESDVQTFLEQLQSVIKDY